jgi:hypothetical protein
MTRAVSPEAGHSLRVFYAATLGWVGEPGVMHQPRARRQLSVPRRSLFHGKPRPVRQRCRRRITESRAQVSTPQLALGVSRHDVTPPRQFWVRRQAGDSANEGGLTLATRGYFCRVAGLIHIA